MEENGVRGPIIVLSAPIELLITELAKQNKTHLLDELVMEDPALIAEILDGAP